MLLCHAEAMGMPAYGLPCRIVMVGGMPVGGLSCRKVWQGDHQHALPLTLERSAPDVAHHIVKRSSDGESEVTFHREQRSSRTCYFVCICTCYIRVYCTEHFLTVLMSRKMRWVFYTNNTLRKYDMICGSRKKTGVLSCDYDI